MAINAKFYAKLQGDVIAAHIDGKRLPFIAFYEKNVMYVPADTPHYMLNIPACFWAVDTKSLDIPEGFNHNTAASFYDDSKTRPATLTGEMRTTGDGRIIRKIESENVAAWVNQKYLDIFAKMIDRREVLSFRLENSKAPVRIYCDDIFLGLVLPVNA